MSAFKPNDQNSIRRARELAATGELRAASSIFGQLVRTHPRDAALLADHCSVLLALGEGGLAAELLGKARRHFASLPYIAQLLAECLLASSRPQDALAVCDDDLSRNGPSLETTFMRALALQSAGRLADAVDAYRRLLAHVDQLPQVFLNLGNAYCALGSFDQAVDCYTQFLQRAPQDIEARLALVSALVERGDVDGAAAAVGHATLAPLVDDARVAILRATVRQIAGAGDEALTIYAQVLGLRSVAALSDPQPEDDEKLQRACASPALHGVVINAAMIIRTQGLHERARDLARGVVAHFPDYPHAHELLGGITLRNGDFASGWVHWRYRRIGFVAERDYPSEAWPPDRYQGKVVLKREQGLGDDILFSRVIPRLASRCELTVVAGERLVELFKAWWPGPNYLTESDYESRKGSLGVERLMGDALADLFPMGAKGETLYPKRHEIRTLTGRRPRVGLSWWSGGKEGRRKSIPIERLASHLAALPAEFVNLQYGEEGARFAEFFGNKAAPSPRERASSLLADAEEIRSCDVVLTCSNTCAHLAGALGVPTLALIPKNNGRFWYWQANHEFCPWYPSIRLVEQTEDGDWEGALAQAKTLILANPGMPATPAAV